MANNDNNNGGNKMSETALNFNSLDEMFGDMFGDNSTEQPANTTTTEITEQKELSQEEQKELEPKLENVSNTNADIAVKKLRSIGSELDNEFSERTEVIDNMLITIVSGSNMLMLGEPGTGKSLLTRELCSRIENGTYFEYMLNKTSDPSEILGPFSVKEMEHDHFTRNTSGKLPEANIAFIDEVYKSNAPVLNSLLKIMNEHIFDNDGKQQHIPLISLFAASNEGPEDDSLKALHDRFLVRMNLEYIHDASSKKKMFNNYIIRRSGQNINQSNTTISIDEIKMLQNKAARTPLPGNVVNKLVSLIGSINKNQNIVISDRRANECIKILQASAVINGRNTVGVSDFNALKYVLWEKQEDIGPIYNEILKIVNPYDNQFTKLKTDFAEIKNNITSATDDKSRKKAFFQYQSSMNSIVTKINKIIAEANVEGKDVTEFTEFRDSITKFNMEEANNALGNITN